MIYLDTSALIKLYILEDGSEEVNEIITSQSMPLPVWEIQEMELVNALRLQVFWKQLTDKQVETQLRNFQERKRQGYYFSPELDRSALMTDFYRLSNKTGRLGCRTLDILHVACAIQIKATRFVSFDQRQLTLAKTAKLTV